jgi:hypothetical protein
MATLTLDIMDRKGAGSKESYDALMDLYLNLSILAKSQRPIFL